MDEIYKKYSKLVYRFLYSLTNNRELSEELMQETFYSAIKGLNNFKHECKISVWLCQIAKNKWKDYLMKSQRIKTISIEDTMEQLLETEDFFEKINEENDILQLYKEVHKLDELTKEVIFLRIKGNFAFKEIAEIVGKSEEWARVTFYRGKIKLKEELSKNEQRL